MAESSSADILAQASQECKAETLGGAAAPPNPQKPSRGADPTTEPPGGSATEQNPVAQHQQPPSRRRPTLDDLPSYTRSLLRIQVPAVVTLARTRRKVAEILAFGPGSIIQFDKSCEQLLELEIAGRPIATGEAVKVGDKFGLRVNAMIPPSERFTPVRNR